MTIKIPPVAGSEQELFLIPLCELLRAVRLSYFCALDFKSLMRAYYYCPDPLSIKALNCHSYGITTARVAPVWDLVVLDVLRSHCSGERS